MKYETTRKDSCGSGAFLHGGLDPFSSSSRKNAWDDFASDYKRYMRNFDPTRSGSKTNNAFKIDIGLFMQIPGWESPQTFLGNTISHFRNLTGKVDEVKIYRWSVLVNDRDSKTTGWWGMTLGPYINAQNINSVHDDNFKHEYGHTIQSRILGVAYMTQVAIPSGISELSVKLGIGDQSSHDNNWFEIWANQLSAVPGSSKYQKHFSRKWWYWPSIVLFPLYPN